MKKPDDIVNACRKALTLAPKSFPADLPTTELLAGAPEWHPFEHEAWAIGENIRQSFSENPKLKKDKRIREEIFAVIQNQNLR